MSMKSAMKKTIIANPEFRGGASVPVTDSRSGQRRHGGPGDGYMAKVLHDLRNDQNLIYLATRLSTYAEICDARLISLRQAVSAGDGQAIADIAHALTDCTSRIGAIGMMKLCIALQLVGRRGLLANAGKLLAELEQEYEGFKESLISAVG